MKEKDDFFRALKNELDEYKSLRNRRLIQLRSEQQSARDLDSVMSRLSIAMSQPVERELEGETEIKTKERHQALVERFNLKPPDILLQFVNINMSIEENFQFVETTLY